VRTVSLNPVLPIIAIFRKDRGEKLYSDITRLAKGVTVETLAHIEELSGVVDFENLNNR
jgi:hypothetical protein